MLKNYTLETLKVFNCLKTFKSRILRHFKQIFKAFNVLLMSLISKVDRFK